MSAPTNIRDFRAGARRVLEKRAAKLIVDPEERVRTATALQFVVPAAWPKEKRDGFEAGLALACKAALDYATRLGQLARPNEQALAVASVLHEAMQLAEAQSKAIEQPRLVEP